MQGVVALGAVVAGVGMSVEAQQAIERLEATAQRHGGGGGRVEQLRDRQSELILKKPAASMVSVWKKRRDVQAAGR